MKEREIEKILKALANKRRLAIISLLKRRPEASVSEIADGIKLSLKATSKHLNILSSVDILSKEQRSLLVFYTLHPERPKIASQIINLL